MRFFLNLSYDGTPFHGWQRQPNAVSVQERIEDTLGTILQRNVEIVGAGRTDTGVHASCMYAHFDSSPIENKEKFLTSANRLIGPYISFNDLIPVVDSAHARFDAVSRSYRYHIIFEKSPFYQNFVHRMYRIPDVDKMNEAARELLNIDDFTSFAKLHSDTKTNICNVSVAKWELSPSSNRLIFNITADRFLRNMVRAVVGTLLEVGTGKLSLDGFKNVIRLKDRCAAGMSMPAKGLFLNNISYPKEIFLL